MKNYQEIELKGKISYSFLEELINSEEREFNIRKNLKGRFILRIGNKFYVDRGYGVNYLHFHHEGCANINILEGSKAVKDLKKRFKNQIVSRKKIKGIIVQEEFKGLPSFNDMDIMESEGKPHIVVSKQGISVYSDGLKIPKHYNLLAKKFGFKNVKSLIDYEAENYDIFRSNVKDIPLKARVNRRLIKYLPWSLANLEEHDFRKVPNLKVDGPVLFVAEDLLLNRTSY